MRELKFRAWDRREGKMWIPIIDKNGTPCALHPISGQIVRMDGELLDPIMQYTGLKDINGVEIFEDDICLTPDDHRCRIIWNINGHWGYNRIPNCEAYQENYWELEVIGNIYENPELLDV